MRNQVNLANALNQQQQDDVLQKIVEAKTILEQFAVNLTKEERKKARNVSDRRLSYVDAVLRAGKNYDRVLPKDIDMTEYELAMKEFIKLKDVFIKLEEIHELVDDTNVALGQVLMYYTDNVYNALQQARKRDAGLDNVMIAIEEHNRRTSASTDDEETSTPDIEPEVTE